MCVCVCVCGGGVGRRLEEEKQLYFHEQQFVPLRLHNIYNISNINKYISLYLYYNITDIRILMVLVL